MTEYTGVRYTAISIDALDKDGKQSLFSKAFAKLRNEDGSINYDAVDKAASGRRIAELKPSDTNWFLSTFQCNNCVIGGTDTVTTIGALAESIPNEHFNQFPVAPERVAKILVDPQLGLLKRWNLNEDISVAFVAPQDTDLSAFIDEKGLIDVRNGGVITSGRHRLTAVMTLFEGLGVPYAVYKNQRVRIRAYRFDSPQRVVEAVQAANFTRTMSPAETKNIQQQLTHGVGSTSSVEKQLDIFTKVKAKATDQKIAFANAFRLYTQDDSVTPLTRFSIATKLFDALWGKDTDEFGQKYANARFDRTATNRGALQKVLDIAVTSYQKPLEGIGNVARDGIKPSVSHVVKLVCKEFGATYNKPASKQLKLDTPATKKHDVVVSSTPVEEGTPKVAKRSLRKRVAPEDSAPVVDAAPARRSLKKRSAL